jgi:hypothetical protein
MPDSSTPASVTIEAAIRQATEAGWLGPEWHNCVAVEIELDDPLTACVWGIAPGGDVVTGLPLAAILLDASFWRALGRARGWGEDEWRQRWHQIIDALTDERSLDELSQRLAA